MHGIGEPVRRTEDPVLLRGQGRYTDDVNEPRQAYAWIVRSQYAHGVLKGIAVEKPKADIYTVMLILSFVAIVIGCLCLYGEMSNYGFNVKAR